MIYFDQVTKHYNDEGPALDNLDLTISAGEFVTITGHTGAGKSTLLRMIIADEHPTDGEVSFGSQVLHKLRGESLMRHRRNIGTVFQDFKLLPHSTVQENIAFAMEASGRSDAEVLSDVPYVLELVNLLGKEHRHPRELSGGEKQRLAIARAIINQPDVVLADEPTGNLDPESTVEVVQILKKINDMGATVVVASHDTHVLDNTKDKRMVTLEKGKVVHDTSVKKSAAKKK